MFKHIDWLLITGYFKSYAICLTSLLSLYIVVDLFLHLDDFFANNSKGLIDVVTRVTFYYAYRIPQLFDRLCEAIVLLAAVFTIAMMQRNNEAIPLLSSGVSMHRIVLPVLVCSAFMVGFSVLNQEFVIPKIGDKLTLERNDPGGTREVAAKSGFEPNLIHIEGEFANRRERRVRPFRCVIPENVGKEMIHIVAAEARYVPEDDSGRGRWEMNGCLPREVEPIPGVLDVIDAGRYVLHTRSVDFESMTRDSRWYNARFDSPVVSGVGTAGEYAVSRDRRTVSHAVDAAVVGHGVGRDGAVDHSPRPDAQRHHQRGHVSGVVRAVFRHHPCV